MCPEGLPFLNIFKLIINNNNNYEIMFCPIHSFISSDILYSFETYPYRWASLKNLSMRSKYFFGKAEPQTSIPL